MIEVIRQGKLIAIDTSSLFLIYILIIFSFKLCSFLLRSYSGLKSFVGRE